MPGVAWLLTMATYSVTYGFIKLFVNTANLLSYLCKFFNQN